MWNSAKTGYRCAVRAYDGFLRNFGYHGTRLVFNQTTEVLFKSFLSVRAVPTSVRNSTQYVTVRPGAIGSEAIGFGALGGATLPGHDL